MFAVLLAGLNWKNWWAHWFPASTLADVYSCWLHFTLQQQGKCFQSPWVFQGNGPDWFPCTRLPFSLELKQMFWIIMNLFFFFFKLQSPCRPNLDFSSQISQTLNSSAGVRRSRRHRAEEELLCSTKADCQRSLASPSGRTLTLTLPLLRCRLFVIIRMAESMCFPLKFKNLFTIIRKACQSPASHLTAAVNFQQRNTATFWGVSYVLGPRSGAQSARWAYSKWK